MANKKKNKIATKKETMNFAKKKNKIVSKPATKKSTVKKQVKVQKVKVNSIPKEVVTENKKTYNIFGYEVKKTYVWVAVAAVVLLCILF